jgi:uncharacterized protein
MAITGLAVEVITPHEPDIMNYAEKLSDLDGVNSVIVKAIGKDGEMNIAQVILDGQALSFVHIRDVIGKLGGSVRFVLQASAVGQNIA